MTDLHPPRNNRTHANIVQIHKFITSSNWKLITSSVLMSNMNRCLRVKYIEVMASWRVSTTAFVRYFFDCYTTLEIYPNIQYFWLLYQLEKIRNILYIYFWKQTYAFYWKTITKTFEKSVKGNCAIVGYPTLIRDNNPWN